MPTKFKIALIGLVLITAACVHFAKGPARMISSEGPLEEISAIDDDSLILSPLPYQVFQRENEVVGFFTLKLKIVVPQANLIRVQVFDMKAPGKWRMSKQVEEQNPPANGTEYMRIFDLPAGGWYRIQVEQVHRDSGQAYRSRGNYFGVGDVFVTAGQSNSTSAGEDLSEAESGMVVMFDPLADAQGHITGGTWKLNKDPQPPEGLPTPAEAQAAGHSHRNFGSTWPAMGDALYKKTGVPIATAETGVGGTTIAEWQKNYSPKSMAKAARAWSDTDPREIFKSTHSMLFAKSLSEGPYRRFMETTKHLLATTGVRMILWHQGESDNLSESQTWPPEVYGDQFRQLQEDLWNDVGEEIPWMMATATWAPGDSHPDGSPCDGESNLAYFMRVYNYQLYKHSLRIAQTKLQNERYALPGPDTDRFNRPQDRYPNKRGRCIHFSKTAQDAVGRLWADHIVATKFNDTPTGATLYTKDLECDDTHKRCLCKIPEGGDRCPNVEIYWKVRRPKAPMRIMADDIPYVPESPMASLHEYKGNAPWITSKPVVFRIYEGTNPRAITSLTVYGSKYGKPMPKQLEGARNR